MHQPIENHIQLFPWVPGADSAIPILLPPKTIEVRSGVYPG